MLPASEPFTEPLPSCKLPPEIVVAPLRPFVFVSTTSPGPGYSARRCRRSRRRRFGRLALLKASTPLLAMLPETEPLITPLPSCKVPLEIVVPPLKLFVLVSTRTLDQGPPGCHCRRSRPCRSARGWHC